MMRRSNGELLIRVPPFWNREPRPFVLGRFQTAHGSFAFRSRYREDGPSAGQERPKAVLSPTKAPKIDCAATAESTSCSDLCVRVSCEARIAVLAGLMILSTGATHGRGRMRSGRALLGIFLLSFWAAPAIAKGQHVSCRLNGTIDRGSEGISHVEKTMDFYLDDSSQELVPENEPDADIIVETTSYSETQILASISDDIDDRISVFGMATRAAAEFAIDRAKGIATLTASFPNGGTMIYKGTCEAVAPPAGLQSGNSN